MPDRPRRSTLLIALFACAILVGTPAAGLTLCLQADGGIEIGLGVGLGCPCDEPHGSRDEGREGDGGDPHAPCIDVALDGLRDRVDLDAPRLDAGPGTALLIALATPSGECSRPSLASPTPRPPDRFAARDAESRARTRAHATRVVTVLVI